MTTLICITATIIVIIAGIAWLVAEVGKWDDEVMDEIINRDRHNYKQTERSIDDTDY
jgi:hypothetical protein